MDGDNITTSNKFIWTCWVEENSQWRRKTNNKEFPTSATIEQSRSETFLVTFHSPLEWIIKCVKCNEISWNKVENGIYDFIFNLCWINARYSLKILSFSLFGCTKFQLFLKCSGHVLMLLRVLSSSILPLPFALFFILIFAPQFLPLKQKNTISTSP